MKPYKYSGYVLIYQDGAVIRKHMNMTTFALSKNQAYTNFRWQAKNKLHCKLGDVDIEDSKIQEVEEHEPERIQKTCGNCGAFLDESGMCPICDLGEEDYYD